MMFKTASRLLVCQSALALGRSHFTRVAVRTMSAAASDAPSHIRRSLSNAYADIHLVPMLQDNYGFIVVDKQTNTCACVDPGDGNVIAKALNELELSLDMILCTHKHNDHIGGVLDLKKLFPSALVVGTKYEDVPGLEAPVGEGDYFQLGNLPVKVMHTPCHTRGHIAFLISAPDNDDSEDEEEQPDEVRLSDLGSRIKSTGDMVSTAGVATPTTATTTISSSISPSVQSSAPLLFCGDTLFVGGCGRFFEGTAAEMLHNLDRFAALDPATHVFCAHEYTVSNLGFLSSVDPSVQPRYEEMQSVQASGKATVPTSIGVELQYNLFMRCREPAVQQLLGINSAVEALQKLRDLKNAF